GSAPNSRQVERLRTVYQLTDAVSRASAIGEVYEAALRGLERAVRADRASILLFDDDGVMRFKAWHGLSDAYRRAVEGHSPWSRDAVDAQPLGVPDVARDEALAAYRPLFESEGIRALAFIPLLSRGRLIGKFMVYFDHEHALDLEEFELARAIAGHVAFAVERIRGEAKLALYREIFAHSSDAIAIIGADGRYLEQNVAHQELIGYADAEILGKTPEVHLGGERFHEVRTFLEAQGVYRRDVISTTKSGVQLDIELSAFTVRDASGAPVCHVGIKRDISQRKRMEEALQFLAAASAALDRSLDYQATVESLAGLTVPYLADWVVVETVGPDGSLRPAASIHVDLRKAELLVQLVALRAGSAAPSGPVQDMAALKPKRVSGPADLLAELAEGDIQAAELLGRIGAASAMVVPLRARGRILGRMTLVSTRRIYQDRDLALADDLSRRGATALDNARLYGEVQESDRRKEEFLAVLAHELRNPMTPLLTCLELMRSPHAEADSIARWREIMERQVRNLARLVDDLLDVSRITRGKIELQKQSIDLATVVARAVETTRPLIQSRGISLGVAIPPGLKLFADPLRVEQVLANLLNNAAKYTPEGGRVDIEGEGDGVGVTVRVRDNGVGIAPDLLPRLFDLFQQGGNASGGLGIGLTLVRTLVELHGGGVRAMSAGPGKGSEFEVRLPIGEAPPVPRTGPPALDSKGEPRRQRTLIVDDNVDAAMLLAEALRQRGYVVHLAHDGKTAVEEALRSRPDVILLDLGLPDLDGYEVASRLRAQAGLEQSAIIAISGYGQAQYLTRSAEAGFSHHIVKPVDMAHLEALLTALQTPNRP
ncbi:MAG TPA: ATP-binding protein, partial [Candidatus Eisenbacteria bacterium]|nr:ATP-binding protein [Candidatus Eisenbacteria bacterium]